MLLSRWKKLMISLGLNENLDTYSALVAAYSENHRYYHDLKHLTDVLASFEEAAHIASRENLIELALWFHDAVYQPFSKENEKESAEWARSFLAENKISHEIRETVYAMIMATCHAGYVVNNDQMLIVDIDLSILGQPASPYREYALNVRKEYAQVPYPIYCQKRHDVLADFLRRERIYYLDYFKDKYEAQARINLREEVACLSQNNADMLHLP